MTCTEVADMEPAGCEPTEKLSSSPPHHPGQTKAEVPAAREDK